MEMVSTKDEIDLFEIRPLVTQSCIVHLLKNIVFSTYLSFIEYYVCNIQLFDFLTIGNI